MHQQKHHHHFFRCRATDHSRWFETNISYRIPYEEGFEPYVLVQRRFVPWYDERFKGYRKNKVGGGAGWWVLHMQWVMAAWLPGWLAGWLTGAGCLGGAGGCWRLLRMG